MRVPARAGYAKNIVHEHLPDLAPFRDVYKDLHANPELSTLEARTARIAAEQLEAAGPFEITRSVGGHGVVGVLKNGRGPTVLLRSELDALPVLEKTGLPYASEKRMDDAQGVNHPVMHACGHDVHIVSLLAASKLLVSARKYWSGTLIVVFQPAEERFGGAKIMVKDGLYSKGIAPRPDILIAQHVVNLPAGTLETKKGSMLAGRRHYTITLYGRSGHASMPHRTIDPVLLAAYILVRLQSIISREISPQAAAVLTCGRIQAGDAVNIIPGTAHMSIDVRALDQSVLEHIDASIRRIVKAECEASGVEKDPVVKMQGQTKPLTTDPDMEAKLTRAFNGFFGERSLAAQGGMASEDFPELAPEDVPYVWWNLGGWDPEAWTRADNEGTLEQLPTNHSDKFAPVIDPTLQTGTQAMAIAALIFLDPAEEHAFHRVVQERGIGTRNVEESG